MFGKLKDKMQQFQQIQKLMKNEDFRNVMSHPKVQALMKDPEVQELMKSQDMMKMASHPKVAGVMRDPEVAKLFANLNPQDLLKG